VTIANEKVLIGNGEQINFSKLVILNDTSAFIIMELQKHSSSVSVDYLTECLIQRYDVEYDVALADIKELLLELESQNIVTIE
jgi:hypothetical protein